MNDYNRDVAKIVRTINSCQTEEQFDSARKMIRFLFDKWIKVFKDEEHRQTLAIQYTKLIGYHKGFKTSFMMVH